LALPVQGHAVAMGLAGKLGTGCAPDETLSGNWGKAFR
jgi:hypothetical protein